MEKLTDAPVRVAAVQAAPVFLDRAATLEKACALIAQAGAAGAKLAVFPECFVPAYPLWAWHLPAAETHALRELYAELLAESVAIPSAATDQLCAAARRAGVNVAIGVNERNQEASGTTLYNTLLYVGADGALAGKHRKLVPTAGERLIHAQGDGSTLAAYDLPIGRVGGLICWENYMPLARYAMYAWGVQIYVAPTWDRGEPWLSTLRHIAKEGRVYVVGCCSALRRDDVPDSYGFKAKYLSAGQEWLNPGDSAIVGPDGKFIAGPVRLKEEILYADVDLRQVRGPRWQLDVAGHYGRPDVFELTVHRDARPMMRIVDGPAPEAASDLKPADEPERP
ncbi:MAG TPA: carbon-nitrogen hydrolase family protein [Terriglobia bacterium]|nr:carbon-nitrogen hydrolase family protein [Terriglobia bacterium]